MTQTEEEHAEMVMALAKDGHTIKEEMTPQQAHLLHMAIGICTEAGELLDAVKKHVIYRKPLDRNNVVEELGDIEFYMEGVRAELDISRVYVLIENIIKLKHVRYPNGYSDQAAIERADKAQ